MNSDVYSVYHIRNMKEHAGKTLKVAMVRKLSLRDETSEVLQKRFSKYNLKAEPRGRGSCRKLVFWKIDVISQTKSWQRSMGNID